MRSLDRLQRQRYLPRLLARVDGLEDEVEPGAEYDPIRAELDRAVRDYGRARFGHLLVSLVFYGSLIGSATAQFGFQVEVFDRVAGVLGLTTVFLLYYASRHRVELLESDLAHAHSHAVGYLSALQRDGTDAH